MSCNSVTVEAIFENGVLHPIQPLSLAPRQRVTVTVHVQTPEDAWPKDVAEIYQEIAGDDRRLAAAMFPSVRETWPVIEDQAGCAISTACTYFSSQG